MADEPYGGSDPDLDDCIRAGMYWFSRRDLEAARAWWERAIALAPDNPKANECLRLLETFETSQSFGADTLDEQNPLNVAEPWKQPVPETASPAIPPIAGDSTWEDVSYPMPGASTEDDIEIGPGERGVWPPPPEFHEEEEINITTDPLEFASMSTPVEMAIESSSEKSPWDGPSRTSVVTLDEDHDEFDAVAEQTPLPNVDKERFFNRLTDDQAIVDYMVATGDLLYRTSPDLRVPTSDPFNAPMEEAEEEDEPELEAPPIPAAPDEIIFDEPVEMSETPVMIMTQSTADMALSDARDRFALHDFQGVIDALEALAPEARTDEADNLIATSRANLLKMYESKIGPTDRTPKVRLSTEEIIWLNLNHRAGFILSQIDGSVTYEDLIALSGMDRLDTVRILAQLVQQRVISSD